MSRQRLSFEAGQRVGRGVVLDPEIRRGKVRAARLRCDCGVAYEAVLSSLVERNGRINTTSCGCAQREAAGRTGKDTIVTAKAAWVAKQPGRGMSSHPLYKVWYAMKQRVENPTNPRFQHYGGRGIQICDRWQDIHQFIADVEAEIGPHPGPGFTFDRKDNDSDYAPGKVRWATYSQQNRNRQPRNGRFKGVSFVKDDRYQGVQGSWVARVHLGRFSTESEAAEAYRRAVEILEREGLLS